MMLHPATRLVVWIALVAFSQLARGPALGGFGLVVMVLAGWLARRRAWRLLRRSRFLVLVLVVLFGFFTPGEAVMPALAGLAPTHEGLALALLHGLRLVLVVLLVALLLETTDEHALVAGLITLASPLAGLGLSVERLAVRVLLVLRYVETPPAGGWRALIGDEGMVSPSEALSVNVATLRWWDRVAMVGVAMAIAWGASQ